MVTLEGGFLTPINIQDANGEFPLKYIMCRAAPYEDYGSTEIMLVHLNILLTEWSLEL